MSSPDATTLLARFNTCINRQDLDGLAALMTDDHTFIDIADGQVLGKTACVEAWRGFFEQFPDYRNIFARTEARGDLALAVGHSTCSEPELAGPAIWTAKVRADQVAEWRVSDDSAATRQPPASGSNSPRTRNSGNVVLPPSPLGAGSRTKVRSGTGVSRCVLPW